MCNKTFVYNTPHTGREGGKTKDTPKGKRKSNNSTNTKTHELFNDASREVNDAAM
jgi:hypothetical protein